MAVGVSFEHVISFRVT